jgi:hypothetical protein
MHRGQANGIAKLTDEQVAEIKATFRPKWGEIRAFANRYNVSEGAISSIVRGKRWQHIAGPIHPQDLRLGLGRRAA